MKDFHQVIYGMEVFDALEIRTENLRLECEEQLKGKLIRLRQAYLEIGTNSKLMEQVLIESLTSLIPVFRAVLRLKDREPQMEKESVIEAVAHEFHVGKEPFLQVLAMKKGKGGVSKDLMENLFGQCLVELEKLAIRQALNQTRQNQVQAAKLLGISRDTLRYRMKKFGLMAEVH